MLWFDVVSCYVLCSIPVMLYMKARELYGPIKDLKPHSSSSSNAVAAAATAVAVTSAALSGTIAALPNPAADNDDDDHNSAAAAAAAAPLLLNHQHNTTDHTDRKHFDTSAAATATTEATAAAASSIITIPAINKAAVGSTVSTAAAPTTPLLLNGHEISGDASTDKMDVDERATFICHLRESPTTVPIAIIVIVSATTLVTFAYEVYYVAAGIESDLS